MRSRDEEEVSTAFIAGLPLDATARELDNLCRFLPGFVNSKADNKRGTTLFALFDTPANALSAIETLNGQVFDRICPGEPMRAVLAKSNMKNDRLPMFAQQSQPPPPSYPIGSHPVGAAGAPGPCAGSPGALMPRRPRGIEGPSDVDTAASVGAAEQGFDENALRAFFMSQPGFLAFKPNPRMGGGFAKFETPTLAGQAISAAQQRGIPMEFAKSSMNVAGSQPPLPTYPAAYPPAAAQQPVPPPSSAKRPRAAEPLGGVDTVASVGATERGIDEAALCGFFAGLPGFVAFRANPRMGGGFAKFQTPALAVQAAALAQQRGIPAEMAKSSMTLSGGAAGHSVAVQPPPPVYQPPPKRPRHHEDPSQVDTVACVGASERGFDESALQSFFVEQKGFITFRPNPRMGGGFAKFESAPLAAEAASRAQERGIPAEMAKTSMSTVN